MADIPGTSGNDLDLDGTILADTIDGKAGDDIIDGNRGGDVLIGGTGQDQIFGGRGDDVFLVRAGEEVAGEIYNGSLDFDSLQVTTAGAIGDIVWNFRGSSILSVERLDFATANNTTVQLDAADIGSALLSPALAVDGSALEDSTELIEIFMAEDTVLDLSAWSFVNWDAKDNLVKIVGDGDAETITGTVQNDLIISGGGNDAIDGGGGSDSIVVLNASFAGTAKGGAGSDTLSIIGGNLKEATLSGIERINFVGSGNPSLILSANQFGASGLSGALEFHIIIGLIESVGVTITMDGDTSFSAKDFAFFDTGGEADGFTLSIAGGDASETLEGSGIGDSLTGAGGSDILTGGLGNDVLDGGTGGDFMFGGSGDDTYKVDSLDDVVGELLFGADPGGDDLVEASVSHAISGFIEDLTLTGGDAINGNGNGLDNAITGNKAANNLFGLGGNDSLTGGKGADLLTGGLGADALTGGNGKDRYIYDSTADSAQGKATRDVIKGFAVGADRIDLQTLDARSDVDGVQDLVLDLGSGLASGEVRIRESNGDTFIEANTDGVAGVDFQILVQNVVGLTAGDLLV